MNQSTHAWIAVRTVSLLQNDAAVTELVDLLKPHAQKAAIGAWIPDLTDAKRAGGSKTENHILKTLPYEGMEKARFTADKQTLLKRMGTSRAGLSFASTDAAVFGDPALQFRAGPKV